MRSPVTRRQWAAALASATAASAQRPAAPAKDSPDQLLAAARDNIRRSREAMTKVKLPASAEPAAVFRA